jgi:hypothetical protein
MKTYIYVSASLRSVFRDVYTHSPPLGKIFGENPLSFVTSTPSGEMKNYKVRMAHSFMSKMEHSDDLKLL